MWKTIKNSNYEINNIGEVRHRYTHKIRKPYNGEYLSLTIYSDKKQTTIFIHRIVGYLFVSNPNNYKFINHLDGNKYNNNANNLEWTTQSKNLKHGYNNNLISAKGSRNGRSILKEEDIVQIRILKNTLSYKNIALQYSVSISTIKDIISKRNWSHVQ